MAQRAARIREQITRVPLRADPSFEGKTIGYASAFFYKESEKSYLITNWHVVSGRVPSNRQPLHAQAAIPDALRLHVPEFAQNLGASAIRWQERLFPLYEDSGHAKPVWLVHPVHRERVDVVAIPLGGLEETALVAANDGTLDLSDLDLYPSLDAYIVGFPKAMFGGARFPIWKRGSIASEPDIDIDDLPKFYVDTATREGMSGAPVYAQEVGLWLPRGKTEFADRVMGKGRMFVGVYSGRIGADDELKAQLGIVWKASAIEEIIRGEAVGESAFSMRGD